MAWPQAAGNENAKKFSAKIQNLDRLPLSMRFARSCQSAHGPPRQRGGKNRFAERNAERNADNIVGCLVNRFAEIETAHGLPTHRRSGDPTPLTAGCGKWMRFVRHQPAPPSRRPRRSGINHAGGARGLGGPGRPPCADKFPGGYGMVQVALGRWISLDWGEGQLPGLGARLSQSLSRSGKCGCGT